LCGELPTFNTQHSTSNFQTNQKLKVESRKLKSNQKAEKLTRRKAKIKRAANKQQANFRGMASTHQYRL
jgi:hypothetical protein